MNEIERTIMELFGRWYGRTPQFLDCDGAWRFVEKEVPYLTTEHKEAFELGFYSTRISGEA